MANNHEKETEGCSENDLLHYYRAQKKLVSKLEKLRCDCDWEKDLANKIISNTYISQESKCKKQLKLLSLFSLRDLSLKEKLKQFNKRVYFFIESLRFSILGPLVSVSIIAVLTVIFIKTGVNQPNVEEVVSNKVVIEKLKKSQAISLANLMKFHYRIREGYAKRRLQMIRKRYLLSLVPADSFRFLKKPMMAKSQVSVNNKQVNNIDRQISNKIMNVYHQVFPKSNKGFGLMNASLDQDILP